MVSKDVRKATVTKAAFRLLPLLSLCYLVSYIDKTGVGMAKLRMAQDLQLSDAMFGFGAGVFFLGYVLFEVPSNLALAKFGARRWIARIMVTWGIVVVLTALVRGPSSFDVMRFLLGVAEAGFYPGVMYYLSRWFPARERVVMIGLFSLANPLSTAIGAPFMGALLGLDGYLGLAGWQWLFVFTGLPAILLAVVVWRMLPDEPDTVNWLTDEEREWLASSLDEERRQAGVGSGHPLKTILDPKVIFFAVWFLSFPTAAYGLRMWLPTIIQSFGVSDFVNGLLNAIPFVIAAVALIFWPRLVAKTGQFYPFLALATLVSAIGLVLMTVTDDPVVKLLFVSIAAFGMFGSHPLFWSLPSRYLVGANAAVGLAVINSIGNLGGFFGPTVVGLIRDKTHGFTAATYFLALVMLFSTLMAGIARLTIDRRTQRPTS